MVVFKIRDSMPFLIILFLFFISIKVDAESKGYTIATANQVRTHLQESI